MSDRFVAPLGGLELAYIIRVLVDFENFRTGKSKKEVFRDLAENAANELTDTEVSSLISQAQVNPSENKKLALLAISTRVDDIFLEQYQRDAFYEEVGRRLDGENSDYIGKNAPNWVKAGVMPPPDAAVSVQIEDENPPLAPAVEQKKDTSLSHQEIYDLVRPWAEQVGIGEGGNSQKGLKSICGEYLILRCLFKEAKIIASHMVIYPPISVDLPTVFFTKGGEGKGQHDFRRVEGVAFSPSGGCNLITVGRIGQEVNLRTAFLTSTEKANPINQGLDCQVSSNMDLYGLRISPGSLIRGQVAHRIWCSKLTSDSSREFASRKFGTYSFAEARETLLDVVDDYDEIIEWLKAVPTITIDEIVKLSE